MRQVRLFYGLVFASGVSGLLYEVVWQRYLAILLGAQAWATVLVLSVYLGGLSAGYFLFGALTRRYRRNLVTLYAMVEAGLALWAFAFPWFFQLALKAIPFWGGWSGPAGMALDVCVAVLLLGVPTVLMGGTLPILTQALSANLDDASQTHAKIYGFNTVGACFGCLLTGYWLIPQFGLAAATRWGGLLNLAVGLSAFWLARHFSATRKISTKASKEKLTLDEGLLLGIGFFSGFYLLALQTVLIRLTGLAAGASNSRFALIVAIFVFCLGFGSLLVRRLGEAGTRRLFWNQAFAAVSLLALYWTGDAWSWGAHLMRALLKDIPQAYAVYQSMLGGVLFALLAVPIGLSGLTLPLCFHFLKSQSERLGQRVGWLYGVNTLGCIAGAFFGGFWLLNFFNLDQVFKLCILCVVVTAAAAAYLARPWGTARAFRPVAAAGLLTLATVGAVLAPRYHSERFIQPFRNPQPLDVTFQGPDAFGRYLGRNMNLVFWKDGPNTTMGVGAAPKTGEEISRTIFVNGKSDGNTNGDRLTTNMLAHLPGLFSDDPARVCVIGFGTGMTVGTLLKYPMVKAIEVAEISGTIILNASRFDRYNGGAALSDRVHFREMDAMRLLGSGREKFDVIISEPSNPWVSGVENLFAMEFYDLARKSLSDHGLFVQWIHTYSFSDELLKRVVATMGRAFPYISIYQLRSGDYGLVGALTPISRSQLLRAEERFNQLPSVQMDIALAGLPSFPTVLALEVMTPSSVRQIVESTGEVHTLTHPKLSDEAAKAFFTGSYANVDDFRRRYRSYFKHLGDSLLRQYYGDRPIPAAVAKTFQVAFCSKDGVKADYLCRETLLMSEFEAKVAAQVAPDWYSDPSRALASLPLFRPKATAQFGEPQLQEAFERFDSFKRYASPVFHITQSQLVAPVDACLKATPRSSEVWGQCLLQKVLILEWLANPSEGLRNARRAYLDWFPTLSPKSASYGKLREAREILEKM